ncbi:MAG TPA: DNA-directed RNA polymerase subunit RpoH/Rpb5 C-terminal domain-containing protein [Thermoplasmata archaeon]|nr:DNA-directed RNA polymerase subunit RpoH/Rpb5 C-terminal domain-containing protein [Thermoplasmata archaeon]
MSTRKQPSKRAKAAAIAAARAERPFTAHHLVPPHELLSEKETLATLQQLGATIERLPKIVIGDPGLRTDPGYVAAREAKEPIAGRLVRIRRPSATAGEAVAYRVLVSSYGE